VAVANTRRQRLVQLDKYAFHRVYVQQRLAASLEQSCDRVVLDSL